MVHELMLTLLHTRNGVSALSDEASMQAGHEMNGDSCTATQTSEHGTEVSAEVESVDGVKEGVATQTTEAEVSAEVESVDGVKEGVATQTTEAEVSAEVESVDGITEGAATQTTEAEVSAEVESVDGIKEGAATVGELQVSAFEAIHCTVFSQLLSQSLPPSGNHFYREVCRKCHPCIVKFYILQL